MSEKQDEEEDKIARRAGSGSSRRRRAKDANDAPWYELAGQERLEELMRELFRLHDLNNDGLLEEAELVTLNEKIAVMHHGMEIDVGEVASKYRGLFRAKLDMNGNPVQYETFRAYTLEVVNGLDSDPEAQEMILEQFVVEAQTGRQALTIEALLKEADFPLKEADYPRFLKEVVAEMDLSGLSQSKGCNAEWRLPDSDEAAAVGSEHQSVKEVPKFPNGWRCAGEQRRAVPPLC